MAQSGDGVTMGRKRKRVRKAKTVAAWKAGLVVFIIFVACLVILFWLRTRCILTCFPKYP